MCERTAKKSPRITGYLGSASACLACQTHSHRRRSWRAYRATINLAFEWRRKAKVKCQSLTEDCLPADNSPSPLAQIIRAEELAHVLDTMDQLSNLAREVVVMHYIEQDSYEEIAQRLGKKPQHIRSVSAKALARLRELLTGQRNRPTGRGQHYDWNK